MNKNQKKEYKKNIKAQLKNLINPNNLTDQEQQKKSYFQTSLNNKKIKNSIRIFMGMSFTIQFNVWENPYLTTENSIKDTSSGGTFEYYN